MLGSFLNNLSFLVMRLFNLHIGKEAALSPAVWTI